MPLDRPVVFPLLPIGPNGSCTCAKGAACSRPGKHPAVLWKEVEEGSSVPMPAPGAGYGIKTGARPRGSGLVFIDLDGEAAVDRWLELGGADPTYTVRTPRPGLHLAFQHPGFYVPNSTGTQTTGLGPKIDVRGDGGFVVGEGSPHILGGMYEVIDDRAPAPLPAWLIAWFEAQPARAEIQPHPEDVTGPERVRRRELYGNWLASEAPICVKGQGGDEILFKVVQRGAYDFALPSEDVLELIEERYDERCEPPWGDELEERVLHKCKSAKTTSTRPRNPPLLVEEEEGLAALLQLEPTRLANPRETPAGDEDTFGFKLKRGGWDETPIPPKYLVDHLLVENKVSMIFAEPGTIKSWTAIDIAACVSSGMPWLGERPTVKGPALYVDFEDGEHEFHRRVHMLTGKSDRRDLIYTYSPGTIQKPEFWVRLEKLAKAYGITLVVIDTLAGGTVGEDENATNAAAGLIYAGWFTESTGATVLVLHHANKTGDIRGTSAFKASVDTLFKLETVEDEAGVHKAKLTCIKSGHKKVYPIHLELTDDGLRKYEPKAEDVGGEDEEKKKTVTEIQGEVLLLIESEGPFASVEMIRERVKTRTSTVSAILAELAATGDIYKSRDGWRRDTEGMRVGRLREALGRLRGCGAAKVVAEAEVTREFFERKRVEGCIRQAIVGDDSGGFIWVDQ